MRLAVVISVLFHLLVLMSLLDLRILPTGTPRKADGALPLSVNFKPMDETRRQRAAFQGISMATDVPPERRWPARMPPHTSPAVVKLHAAEAARVVGGESRSPSFREGAENVAFLPADLEREYRLNLAREVRQSQYYPAELVAKGQQGIVRMTIWYWSGLGRPSVALEQSSGYGELDQDALKTMALAIARVRLPEGVQGVSFRMQYALEYRLAD